MLLSCCRLANECRQIVARVHFGQGLKRRQNQGAWISRRHSIDCPPVRCESLLGIVPLGPRACETGTTTDPRARRDRTAILQDASLAPWLCFFPPPLRGC